MRAVGFGEPVDSYSQGAKADTAGKGNKDSKASTSKTTVTLTALPSDLTKIPRLPPAVLVAVKSYRMEIEQEIVALEGAPSVSAAIREMRVFHSLSEVRAGAETALTIVRNVLSDPKDLKMYRVKRSNPAFQRSLGNLKSSELLMHAIGFLGGQSGDEGGGLMPSHVPSSEDLLGTTGLKDFTEAEHLVRSNAAYVLHSVSKGGFDPTAALSKGTGKS